MSLQSLTSLVSTLFKAEKGEEIYCRYCGKTASVDKRGNYYCTGRKCPQRREDRIEDFDHNENF